MRIALTLCFFLLVSCSGYDKTASIYGGANSEAGGTVGARAVAYLVGDESTDGGIGLDASGLFLEEADQFALSPLMMIRWRATDYLEPYIGAGPALIHSDWSYGSDWDLGVDFRLGIHYRVGDIAGNPCWLFVEARGLFSQVDTSVASASSAMARLSSGGGSRRGREEEPPPMPEEPPHNEPPDDPIDMEEDRDLAEIDDWSVHLVIGLGIRW
jgi:hypothetical protein